MLLTHPCGPELPLGNAERCGSRHRGIERGKDQGSMPLHIAMGSLHRGPVAPKSNPKIVHTSDG